MTEWGAPIRHEVGSICQFPNEWASYAQRGNPRLWSHPVRLGWLYWHELGDCTVAYFRLRADHPIYSGRKSRFRKKPEWLFNVYERDSEWLGDPWPTRKKADWAAQNAERFGQHRVGIWRVYPKEKVL